MPMGVAADCVCVLAGALLGCFAGKYVSPKLRSEMNVFLGICSMSIGINSIVRASSMAPVVLSVLLGYMLGHILGLEERLTELMGKLLKKLPLPRSREFVMEQYITVVVLFCASGFAIYGTFAESMSGDSSILLSKAVLDIMTALFFAASLGYAVLVIPFFMSIVLLSMFALGKVIAPAVTPGMLQDFISCGGILTLAAGLRVAGIKNTKITNLIPALILVMPVSGLWAMLI